MNERDISRDVHDPVVDRTAGLSNVAVIIPALNEARGLEQLLPRLIAMGIGQVLVCDNGSTDDTRDVVRAAGADRAFEPRRGYGAACQAGLTQLAQPINIVAFADADQHDAPDLIEDLVTPIINDECDLVIGSRIASLREPGAATASQRFANWLLPLLIRMGWGHRYTDLGPFRAVKRDALERIGMNDRAYGWTIEMQIRAVEIGLRIREIPVPHQRRQFGRNRITGTVRGVVLAGYWIVRTCALLWLTKRSRRKRDATNNAR